ncbi:hypothetical protein PanWU01x14_312650, partial [Parasponia andersonii]
MHLGTAPSSTEYVAGRFVCLGHIVHLPSASVAFKLSKNDISKGQGLPGSSSQ